MSQRGWERDSAHRAGLGVFDRHGAGSLGRDSLHFDSTRIEIEVAELEAEGFVDAHAGECEKADEQAELVTGLVVGPQHSRSRVRDFVSEGFDFLRRKETSLSVGDLAMRMPSTGLTRIAPERRAEPQIWDSTLRCFEIEAADKP